MKTSDAMRLADEMGIPNRRKAFVEEFVRNWHGEKPPSCAIGGAAIAAGLSISPDGARVPEAQLLAAESPATSDWLAMRWSVITGCPSGSERCSDAFCNQGLESWIIHLYDNHKWTRTQIADWLDTVVPA